MPADCQGRLKWEMSVNGNKSDVPAGTVAGMEVPFAEHVAVTDDTLTVDLSDGRSVSIPLAWYPRLAHGSAAERADWKLIGKGHGIHWQELDEDVNAEGLLAGRPSGESQSSLDRWLASRNEGR